VSLLSNHPSEGRCVVREMICFLGLENINKSFDISGLSGFYKSIGRDDARQIEVLKTLIVIT
jgi:hypothetical protein